MFTPYSLAHFEYTKVTDGTVSERYVIPTSVPSSNTRMIGVDVTDCNEEARSEIATLMEEYNKYREDAIKRLFSFEDWITHTTGMSELPFEVKWRSFYTDLVSPVNTGFGKVMPRDLD